jgi:hypothetical protein
MIGRVLRAPALHFLVIGAVLFAARGRFERAPDPAIAAIDPAELAGLGPEEIEDEVLHREALALGLDRRDGTVGERLRRLGAFVGEDSGNEAALEESARRLGLDRSDLVVRRHLVEMVRLATGRLGAGDMPSETELRAYLEQHPDDFAAPERLRLTHVYLARDRHGAALESDALQVLGELRRDGVDPSAAAARGDAFLGGAEIGPASAVDLDRMFGAGFASALADAPVARWVGPVRSSYGLHLVWVRDRLPAGLPALDAVRGRVLHRMLRERSAERSRERIDALRARYAPGVVQN